LAIRRTPQLATVDSLAQPRHTVTMHSRFIPWTWHCLVKQRKRCRISDSGYSLLPKQLHPPSCPKTFLFSIQVIAGDRHRSAKLSLDGNFQSREQAKPHFFVTQHGRGPHPTMQNCEQGRNMACCLSLVSSGFLLRWTPASACALLH
jgi:hypothetical protein